MFLLADSTALHSACGYIQAAVQPHGLYAVCQSSLYTHTSSVNDHTLKGFGSRYSKCHQLH